MAEVDTSNFVDRIVKFFVDNEGELMRSMNSRATQCYILLRRCEVKIGEGQCRFEKW